jgi:uncharacterized protein YyaL (SSP411 family)
VRFCWLARRLLTTPLGAEPPFGKLNWLPSSDAVFSQAKHERRFVLLDVEAVWGYYQYPSVPPTAAYVCTERTCSVPIFNAEALAGEVNQVLGLGSMNA